MRNILFKAKFGESWIQFPKGDSLCIERTDERTVCEYTGLEVKGQRLFENDKFVYKSESSEFESYVVFRVGAFGFIDGDKFVSFASMGLLLEDFLNHITITGNINDTD